MALSPRSLEDPRSATAGLRFKSAAMDDGLQRLVSLRWVPKVVQRICVLGGESTARALEE